MPKSTKRKISLDCIRLKGVRQNNLKGFDIDIPLGKLIVVTGLSGAGKSSLVFETLHAEGNRRYAETFSPYVRQFLELADRPKVDSIENIRPSIAVEQGNTVKTSRSTVGTMTELCDYFKVWFSQVAQLYDPKTNDPIEEDSPEKIYRTLLKNHSKKSLLVCFSLPIPESIPSKSILSTLLKQGYTRVFIESQMTRIEDLVESNANLGDQLTVIQDRIQILSTNEKRIIEALTTAYHYGNQALEVRNPEGKILQTFFEDLRSKDGSSKFRPLNSNLFSFNSPVGACPKCRGFGRVIEIDPNLVIPNRNLSLSEGAVKAFSGAVYSESQKDLLRECRKLKISTTTPWKDLSEKDQIFVYEGDPDYDKKRTAGKSPWYGVRRFFDWLEENTYKMHVRVFLSRYRAYVRCPECHGSRLQSESLCWKWEKFTLPDLYQISVAELYDLIKSKPFKFKEEQAKIAHETILTRLSYLNEVGLGYLNLDRSSRSLSGGETQRVNLTSCLGTALVDTLFILDEPSIGLHSRDIDRLIKILRQLTDMGNTVVVVEHDEAIMKSADHIIEVGPKPGSHGGLITYQGSLAGILKMKNSPTGNFLSGSEQITTPTHFRSCTRQPKLRISGITKHNLNHLSVSIPLNRWVVLTGVSGSGKSTLLNNVIYQGLISRSGLTTEDPAQIEELDCPQGFSKILMVDQSPVSRTPRSTPALYVNAWDPVRDLFAQTDAARSMGFSASHFSFNSGQGRCPHCEGLGFERVEMQFMADLFVQCPICEGQRFSNDILEIKWFGKSVSDVLNLTIDEALEFFNGRPKITNRLEPLVDLGLGYLPLGQPLNTLSGGESQRLKLVSFVGKIGASADKALILLDEPTTGLHKADIQRLVSVLHQLVDKGHSLVLIEHHPDVIKNADWILELGPEAGSHGGEIVFEGTPQQLIASQTHTAPFVEEAMAPYRTKSLKNSTKKASSKSPGNQLVITGAQEHNLKNLTLSIPQKAMTVVTGVSGSGKSTLAFDIVFAEGQRRFMESMSSWARQYVEQLPRPHLDKLEGISPSVAIEQRVTRGSRKSTVATITEVAQYLRLMFARIGIQHSPKTGEPLSALPEKAIADLAHRKTNALLKARKSPLLLMVPLIRSRKGHHEPLAKWAQNHRFEYLKIDGHLIALSSFKRLDRFKEHDIDLVIGNCIWSGNQPEIISRNSILPLKEAISEALRLGKQSFYLADEKGSLIEWFSAKRTDPVTGEAYPDLDPKHFSWNSAKGWCPHCRGHGQLYTWMNSDENFSADFEIEEDGLPCPACHGDRLNPISSAVFIYRQNGARINFPKLLSFTADELIDCLQNLQLDRRAQVIVDELFPEIVERLKFLKEVGLHYLSLNRPTNTLSGGEAQRIRLASQLGSNLSGVLYVLDEPSIGLHSRDNDRLIQSLLRLKDKGNTLLVVEHDTATMKAADMVIDLGPGAGIHGGEILAQGSLAQIKKVPKSITGQYLQNEMVHPQKGTYRNPPPAFNPRAKKSLQNWIHLSKPKLRNLKGHSVGFAKGQLNVVCGISGAGKSTLVRDVLKTAIETAIQTKRPKLKGDSTRFDFLYGGNKFGKVIEVDQSPIGKTPRSTPATYIGAFDRIRKRFADLPEAKMYGYTPGTFSFNSKGGRCESCQGAGRIKLEMSFMPDTFVPCDDCQESRYSNALRSLCWRDKNISDVLQMTFEEAAIFFEFDTPLAKLLNLMVETGLGYLTLGQSSPTLSGGEAQRLKLVSELAKGVASENPARLSSFTPNLYILEEPTIGLHLHDCQRLIHLLHRLVDQGHTVIVIEHHLDLILEADHLIELGPEGGSAGGEIIFQGPLSELPKVKHSPTLPFIHNRIALHKQLERSDPPKFRPHYPNKVVQT